MALTFVLKNTDVLNKVPLLSDILRGEIAVNPILDTVEGQNSLNGIYIRVGTGDKESISDKVVRIGNVYVSEELADEPSTYISNGASLDFTGSLWFVTSINKLFININGLPSGWVDTLSYATALNSGVVTLATGDDLYLETPSTKAVTPDLIPPYVTKRLSPIIKDRVNLRLSASSTKNECTIPESATSIFLHPFCGGDIALYDIDQQIWKLYPVSESCNPQEFTLVSIGVSSAYTKYDLYIFNTSADITQPLMSIYAEPWTDINTPPQRDNIDGIKVRHLFPNQRLIGILTTKQDGTVDKLFEGMDFYCSGSDPCSTGSSNNGTDGQDGVGVVSAAIVSGNLIFTLSDGSTINAGALPTTGGGQPGADGVSVTGASVVSGNLIFTLSNGNSINIGPLPAGPQGNPGTNGSNGSPGLNGISVVGASVSGGNLLLTLSNGSTINAGALPVAAQRGRLATMSGSTVGFATSDIPANNTHGVTLNPSNFLNAGESVYGTINGIFVLLHRDLSGGYYLDILQQGIPEPPSSADQSLRTGISLTGLFFAYFS